MSKVEIQCKNCSKLFIALQSYVTAQIKRGHSIPKYCSIECYREMTKNKPRPQKRTCKKCGNVYQFTSDYFSVRSRCKYGLESVCKQCHADRNRLPNKKSAQKLRFDILFNYSDGRLCCSCCGENTYEFLTLDHINGGGRQERLEHPGYFRRLRKTGYPSGYRVLCYNCNCCIGRYGYCPHQTKTEIIYGECI